MKELIQLVNERCTQPPKRTFSRKSEDSWPFMAQGDMLAELERLVCPLTSQTLRRWQKDKVISAPSRYNIGSSANIASYKLFACAECYAAAILSFGKPPMGDSVLPSSMMPKINLATIAYLRYCAYGHGEHPVLPRREKIENALGQELPDMPEFSNLNLSDDPGLKAIAEGPYAEYYEGCLGVWKTFFVDGMIKFGQKGKLFDPKRHSDADGHLNRSIGEAQKSD